MKHFVVSFKTHDVNDPGMWASWFESVLEESGIDYEDLSLTLDEEA